MLSVSGIQCDLRDVSYYIKKKQGFPSVTDKGVMDIVLAGSGLSFKVAMETADKTDRQHFFKVNTVNVDLKNMNIILKQSNHKILFKLFKPLLLKVMTPVITKVIEKQIRDNIHQLDGLAYQVHAEAKRAEADAKNNPDPENIQNIYQRYATAANNRMMQGKQKSKEVASDKQVNVAVTQHDSLFPNIKLPGGISTKATEYKELAARGDKWESPIFGIGSAKETSTLPKLAKVTRKHHNINTEGIIGGNHPNAAGSGSGAGYGTDGTTGGQGLTDRTGGGYGQSGTAGAYGQSGTTGGYGNDGLSGTTGGYGSSGAPGAGYGSDSLSGTTGGYGNDSLSGSTGGYSNTGSVGNYGSTGTHGGSGLTGAATGAPGSGLGHEHTGTQGFTNQVEQAFEGTGSGTGTGTGAPGSATHQGGTLFGANNPVFQGRV